MRYREVSLALSLSLDYRFGRQKADAQGTKTILENGAQLLSFFVPHSALLCCSKGPCSLMVLFRCHARTSLTSKRICPVVSLLRLLPSRKWARASAAVSSKSQTFALCNVVQMYIEQVTKKLLNCASCRGWHERLEDHLLSLL